jgi:hypothetical protein
MKKKIKLTTLTKNEMSKILGSLGEASGSPCPPCMCTCISPCPPLGPETNSLYLGAANDQINAMAV